MKVAIVTTGDEIMAGNVVDTNATWMSDRCWRLGAKVVWRCTVADDAGAIGEACQLAAKKAGVVLVSGGLGPTADDITLEAAAKAFHKKKIGGKAIPNKVGTAPGCQVKFGGALFFFLPGVPKELYPMFESSVLPWMQGRLAGKLFYGEKIFRCFGAREAALDKALRGISLGDIVLSFRVRFPEVLLKLVCRHKQRKEVERLLACVEKELRARVGDYIYGEGEESLAEVVEMLLRKRRETVAVAESCTGGFIANTMTDIGGSSQYFERGVVAYSNRSKMDLLEVNEGTLKKFGSVSEEVVQEMAIGARKISGATYGLAVTGIAGPGGGTLEKPLGTVYIALATPEKTEVKHFCFPRSRLEFKQLVSATALDWLRKELK